MHVHANYNLQLAAMGSNRDEVHEMAARRAAEVRRRLAATESALVPENDEVVFAKVAAPDDSDPNDNAYSTAEGEEQKPEASITERKHGSHFSALA